MRYRLNASVWGQVFAVPSAVIDQHIRLANGVAFKALLALLRDPDGCADETALAKRLGMQRADVSDALSYWIESGVLRCDSAEEDAPLPAVRAAPREAAPVSLPCAGPAAPSAPTPAQPAARPRFPREEALAIIEGDKVLGALVHEAQSAMGKTFTSADMDVLLGLYSYHALSPHYIITLLHYCVSIGRRSMAYAETAAASWMADGVDDSNVDAQVDRLTRRRSNEGRVRAAFGIGDRRLVPREREMISRWFDEWGFDLDMINLAYEIAVERTGKLVFRYIDKILFSWHTQGIKTPEQAKNESRPAAAPNDSELDRQLFEHFMKE